MLGSVAGGGGRRPPVWWPHLLVLLHVALAAGQGGRCTDSGIFVKDTVHPPRATAWFPRSHGDRQVQPGPRVRPCVSRRAAQGGLPSARTGALLNPAGARGSEDLPGASCIFAFADLSSRPSEPLLARRGHGSRGLPVAVSWQRPQVTSYRVMVVPDF